MKFVTRNGINLCYEPLIVPRLAFLVFIWHGGIMMLYNRFFEPQMVFSEKNVHIFRRQKYTF